MARRFLAGLAWASLLAGQSLHVSQTGGQAGSLAIALESRPHKAIAALQWNIFFPPALSVELTDIVAGSAAQSAGKSITCAKSAARGTKFACILAGGKKDIGNGTIAVIYFHLGSDVKGAPIRVPIDHVLGVTVDLKPVPMPSVDAIVSTRATQ